MAAYAPPAAATQLELTSTRVNTLVMLTWCTPNGDCEETGTNVTSGVERNYQGKEFN